MASYCKGCTIAKIHNFNAERLVCAGWRNGDILCPQAQNVLIREDHLGKPQAVVEFPNNCHKLNDVLDRVVWVEPMGRMEVEMFVFIYRGERIYVPIDRFTDTTGSRSNIMEMMWRCYGTYDYIQAFSTLGDED